MVQKFIEAPGILLGFTDFHVKVLKYEQIVSIGFRGCLGKVSGLLEFILDFDIEFLELFLSAGHILGQAKHVHNQIHAAVSMTIIIIFVNVVI